MTVPTFCQADPPPDRDLRPSRSCERAQPPHLVRLRTRAPTRHAQRGPGFALAIHPNHTSEPNSRSTSTNPRAHE
jgi:hypothetical protein